VLAGVFLWPLGASVVASFSREGQWTLANYATVANLYARDVAYTIGVAAAGTALTFCVAIPVCGWLRVRAYGPVEFLLKVPLFVPFVVVGHALRVFWSPYVPSFSSSWAGIATALAWKHLGLAALLLAVGGVLGLVGWRRRVSSPLAMTRKTVKEDMQWAKERLA